VVDELESCWRLRWYPFLSHYPSTYMENLRKTLSNFEQRFQRIGREICMPNKYTEMYSREVPPQIANRIQLPKVYWLRHFPFQLFSPFRMNLQICVIK